MKELRCDVLIIGAGLTGLMTAYALSALKLEIIVIDKFKFASNKFDNHDLRTTAIAEGSKNFLEEIGFWNKIKSYSEPIKNIEVIDRTESNKLHFENSKKESNLGYIVKNNIIKKEILKCLKIKKNIKLLEEKKLIKILYKEDTVISSFENLNIKSNLIVAADGKKSFVRNLFKTPQYFKQYKQNAMVVNFQHQKRHNSAAFELFFNTGPLAILPMKKTYKDSYSSSVIWSHNIDFINSLKNIKKETLSLILEKNIKQYVGKINKIVDIQFFNLSSHLNLRFYEKRLIFLGDSAHSIHPIAGQGWNLGIRDIKNLLELTNNFLELGLIVGSLTFCKEYHNQTFYDSYSLFQITDKLNKIFIDDSFLTNNFRSTGFKLINKNRFLKNYITNFAMGF